MARGARTSADRARGRPIVGEFIAELTPLERRVFALVAEGRSWRAIATALGLAETEARNTTRACERKRARFLTLYSTGRLCGYRSQTIGAVLNGSQRSELAVSQALAHLHHCRDCQNAHRTSAAELRGMFDERVLVLLPAPLLVPTHPWLVDQLHRASVRLARVLHRASTPQVGAHDRILETAAGTSAAAKLAAGVFSVAVLAGGAVGVTSSLQHHHARRRYARHPAVVAPTEAAASVPVRPARARHYHHRSLHTIEQHTPGGFAYLGAPSHPQPRSSDTPVVVQHGGGSFGP